MSRKLCVVVVSILGILALGILGYWIFWTLGILALGILELWVFWFWVFWGRTQLRMHYLKLIENRHRRRDCASLLVR